MIMVNAVLIGWTLGNAVNRVLGFAWRQLAGPRGRYRGGRLSGNRGSST